VTEFESTKVQFRNSSRSNAGTHGKYVRITGVSRVPTFINSWVTTQIHYVSFMVFKRPIQEFTYLYI